MRRLPFAPLACLVGLAYAPVALAAPTIFSDLTIIENRPLTGDIFGVHGLRLLTRVNASTDGTGATVAASNGSFPFASPPTSQVALVETAAGSGSWVAAFAISESDFDDLEGTYTYRVTDGSSTTPPWESHDLDLMAALPLPTNLAVSDSSTTPVFTYVDPDPSPAFGGLTRAYNTVIYDSALNEVAILPSPTTSSEDPSFQVPGGLLTAGQQYYFRAQILDLDRESGDFYVENTSLAYLAFTPVPETAHIAALGGLLLTATGACTRRVRQ